MSDISILAYYLPQYHPIPENDEWWGKGFTEWTNVTKAKPLFKGHHQPDLPADLGFYDLRVPEVQRAQSEMASQYGVDGFIYYHYWFGNGKLLLERPAEQMLLDPAIRLPFCFCWANQTWAGVWHGIDDANKVLIEQQYPGKHDVEAHFNYLLPFFKDDRYIKVGNRPMLHLYMIENIPNSSEYISWYDRLAKDAGFDGLYVVASYMKRYSRHALQQSGADAVVGIDSFQNIRYRKTVLSRFTNPVFQRVEALANRLVRGRYTAKRLLSYNYEDGVRHMMRVGYPDEITYFPCVIPNWDNSPRVGRKALVFKNSNPDVFRKWLSYALQSVSVREQYPKFVVIKSWNEWAEGNHLEPCQRFGHGYLEAVRDVKSSLCSG